MTVASAFTLAWHCVRVADGPFGMGLAKFKGLQRGLGGFMGLAKMVEALGLQSSRGFKGLAALG